MRTVTTRTQRRVERKQALALLVMVLAVALVSFSLGVMVGRGFAPREATKDVTRRLPLEQTPPSNAPVSKAKSPSGEPQVDLTFYDTLPKGEGSPLGSGINVPPSQRPEGSPGQDTKPVPAGPVPSKAPRHVAEKPVAESPLPSGQTYVLQVASFRTAADALALSQKLQSRGFPSRVKSVDLGEKGGWSRVLVGPFSTKEKAQEVLLRLKSEERLAPMLRTE